ncbi:hypothetical protein GDO78_015716 [Eleutherodactylus coqui]|uniref:Nitrilase 1 n=1 Tax=Eleutherodactylus coqui TaxID=57060 RepID=A0A8J6E8H4_ELECQ|nr:hypothetical protein GDO78_015716 [Eleutherodactylus coqui]
MRTAGVMAKFRLALVQLLVSPVKSDNLERACELVKKAAQQGAQIVALPVSMIPPSKLRDFRREHAVWESSLRFVCFTDVIQTEYNTTNFRGTVQMSGFSVDRSFM